jgi:rhodanese-related sulfurtransferase
MKGATPYSIIRALPESLRRPLPGLPHVKFLAENIVLVLIAIVSGGMLLWPVLQRRGSAGGLDTLSATRLINDSHAVVLDVREPAEFGAGHLPNSRNIPLGELADRAGELPAGKPVIVVCASGPRAGRAAGMLRKGGREDVFTLDGGLNSWRQAGLPVVK